MPWFANFIIANIILLLDGKFDGSQKLHLANNTRCTKVGSGVFKGMTILCTVDIFL